MAKLRVQLSETQVREVQALSDLVIPELPKEKQRVWQGIRSRCAEALDFAARKRAQKGVTPRA